MHRNRNITDNLNSTFLAAGIFDFGHLENVDNQHCCFCKNALTFTGKEKDSETGFYYFGARYYDPSLSGLFLSVDPMADKYPSISPYAYCAWNPVKLVDPDGREAFIDPYVIYNGKTKTFQIWDDNRTPDDFSDDTFLGQFNGANNVSLKDNPKGNWEDGVYPMIDKTKPYKHYDRNGNPAMEKGKDIPQDSKYGSYGIFGIFRAQDFVQDDGVTRSGMGFHSGRGVTEDNVSKSFTLGCIRVSDDAMQAVTEAIDMFGPLTRIIIQDNRQSSKSADANSINPGKGMHHVILKPVVITKKNKE